ERRDVDLLDLLEHLDVGVVDLARGFLERAGDHLERRGVVQVRGLLRQRLLLLLRLLRRRRRRGRHPRRGRAGRIVSGNRLADGGLRRDDRLDVVARHELDVAHGEHVRRVRHRDRQRRAGAAERDDLVLLRRLVGNQLDDVGIDLELREVDRRHAVLLREQRRDLFVFDEVQLDEIESELAAVGLLVVQRYLQLGRRNALLLEQQLANTDGHYW